MKTKLIIAGAMVVVFGVATTLFFSMTTKYTESMGIAYRTDIALLIIVDDMPISVSNQSFDENLFSDIQTGDKVEITHDGVAESYPAQTGVYKLSVIQKDCLVEVSQDTLDTLTEMGWIAV